MKKILATGFLFTVILACNNSADTSSDKDSIDNKRMNTTVYDSTDGKREGDTSSYEHMSNKISDSIPQ